jgi:hypothetical protein
MESLEILNVQLGPEKGRIVFTISEPTNSSKELVMARDLITPTVCYFLITLVYAY